jgi:hypothetical protein
VGGWLLEIIGSSFDSSQFGARKGRSTSHALVSILHEWMTALDSGSSVRAVFVDFRKAFDHVDHNLLIHKLMSRDVPHCLIKWFYSYLSQPRQRVRLNGELSQWMHLRGGMPQGSWLGPLSFLVLIDDLSLACLIHKYVDDTTLTEILPTLSHPSSMPSYLQQLQIWTQANHMIVNTGKTKEMILGPLSKSNIQELSIGQTDIERVTVFKLLGVHIANDLRWNIHIDKICSRASTRLHFLKQLKRAGLAANHLLHFYLSAVRPVLEYCSVVWHHGLTNKQCERLESIQRRAIRIIYDATFGMPYQFALAYAELPALHTRREQLNKSFWLKIINPDSCLFSLLPALRDTAVISRLRSARPLPIPRSRTARYRSFVHYGLANCQHCLKNH